MLLEEDDAPSFFRPDLFHVYHSGVGKDFLGSSFIYAIQILLNRGGVDRNIQALNDLLKAFLRRTKLYLHCRTLSPDTLGYSSTKEYPEGHWSKNQDTAVLMRFLVELLEDHPRSVSSDAMLTEMLLAARAMGNFMRTSFQADYFMSSADCQKLLRSGHQSLMGYRRLASFSYDKGLCLYKLKPKIHYLNHIVLTVKEQWLASGTAVNPVAEATFMSEDFVGQIARASRRVNAKVVTKKTLQRYDLMLKAALDNEELSLLDLSWID